MSVKAERVDPGRRPACAPPSRAMAMGDKVRHALDRLRALSMLA
jgi:hypothetical protein